jgi:hypothetical protein
MDGPIHLYAATGGLYLGDPLLPELTWYRAQVEGAAAVIGG